MSTYLTVLAPELLKIETIDLGEFEAVDSSGLELPEEQTINIIILSILLVLGLSTNFLSFPVILFRRTKFGNGQFAILVFCLTIADLLTVTCGLLGGLVLEVGQMTWQGSSPGCSAYYFLTSWLLGLANYLVSALLGMIHVKRSTGWISRLQECKTLLLSMTLVTLLPALTELAVRSTVNLDDNTSVCIITAEPAVYLGYVTVNLVMCHLIPMLLVLVTVFKPRTRVAQRFSTLFLGEGSACECGSQGGELEYPHECPSISPHRPDLVTSHTEIVSGKPVLVAVHKGKTRSLTLREDPYRRKYKGVLARVFIILTSVYSIANLSFQMLSLISTSDDSGLSQYLVPAVNIATYSKQIVNPLIFVYVEFLV